MYILFIKDVANNKRLNCINLNKTIYKKYGN